MSPFTRLADASRPVVDPRWPRFAGLKDLQSRFADFLSYAELVLGHSPASIQWYCDSDTNFQRFLVETGRTATILLDPPTLEAWIAWLRTRPRKLSARSLKTYWQGLRRFGRDLAVRDSCDDAFRKVRGPNARNQIPHAISPTDCERILATAVNYPWPNTFIAARNVAMLATALYAGLRRKEILRLERTHVDLEDGVIHVIDGKGPDGGTKRTAYIPDELRTILRRYSYERDTRKYKCPEFFVAERKRGRVAPITLQRVVLVVRRAAGIHFSLHGLRHSFVTMLLRSGVPIHVASALAGHSSIATTNGYAKAFDEDRRRFAQYVRFRGASARALRDATS